MRGLTNRYNSLYVCWKAMIYRCYKPTHKAYRYYGGRGIVVCKEWQTDFAVFLEWALANGYRKGLTLDRINNDLGYSSANCRWTDWKTQSRNTRRGRRLNYNGRFLCIGELSEICGIPPTTLRQRLIAYCWPMERAITEPVRRVS